jgi:hypothetical protein
VSYSINSVSSPNQVLDVSGLGKDNSTTIMTWAVTKANNQQFFIRSDEVERVTDGAGNIVERVVDGSGIFGASLRPVLEVV